MDTQEQGCVIEWWIVWVMYDRWVQNRDWTLKLNVFHVCFSQQWRTHWGMKEICFNPKIGISKRLIGSPKPKSVHIPYLKMISDLERSGFIARIFSLPESKRFTLPETNIAHENPHLSWVSYHQNGEFSMAHVSLQEGNWQTSQHIC